MNIDQICEFLQSIKIADKDYKANMVTKVPVSGNFSRITIGYGSIEIAYDFVFPSRAPLHSVCRIPWEVAKNDHEIRMQKIKEKYAHIQDKQKKVVKEKPKEPVTTNVKQFIRRKRK